MKRKLAMVPALVITLSFFAGFAPAADQTPAQENAQTQQEDQIYGSQLMTQEERTEYHAKMRAAKTVEEREQIRNEHHEIMQDRAKKLGVSLPDEPSYNRGGRGMGSGSGMDHGGGTGHGGGGNGGHGGGGHR